MAIDLESDQATGQRFPSVKLRQQGDVWVGMLVDYDGKAPLYKFNTRERAVTDDGREKTKDVLTVMLLGKSKCMVLVPGETGGEGEEVHAADGMVVRVHIQGHNRWTQGRSDCFREVKEKHGKFQVGDVVWGSLNEITLIGAEGRRLTQAKHVIGFGMRKPKPEEAALVQRCEAEHMRLNAVDLEPAAVSAGPSFDEEPF